jgi:hypothetical protein
MKKIFTFALVGAVALGAVACSKDKGDDQTPKEFEYGGHGYVIVRESKSWADAAADAVSRGGYLVNIDSQGEQEAVYKAIRDAGISASYTSVGDGGGVAYVWIGAKATSARVWAWHGSNTIFWNGDNDGGAEGGRYYNWGGRSNGGLNEPDDFTDTSLAPNGQDAAAIGLASWPKGASSPLGVAGEWNDIANTNRLYYVVEKE